VGFRPFVYGLAERCQLTGWVKNDDAGVLLEVEGHGLDGFLVALRTELPPLARIDAVEVEHVAPRARDEGFAILASERGARVSTGIGADAAPCKACLAECFDPRDRRYRYPFLNCTHCGPRFTITRTLPYDRAQTSMASFPMCGACELEYHDPRDRRFHAQPTACPSCGPALSRPVEEIVERLRAGEIVAIKGLGGFHLACDATNHDVVSRLRRAKQRDGKPFAVMVAGVASARELVCLGDGEATWLSSVRRPIVLSRRLEGDLRLAPDVAPGLAWLGVMLPSSPLHYLLFHEAAGRPTGTDWLESAQPFALVMTSANPGGEPLVTDDEDAARRLQGICDTIVGHDRDIVVRCDDPVVRIVSGAPLVVRRGRGFVPDGIDLPREVPSVLAAGAFLKNAVCLTRGGRAYLSQHIGDMDNAETYRFFEESIRHLQRILDVEPVAVAHDLHPDFLSTEYALGLGIPCVPVQHHHAHLAAVLVEHGLEGPHVGLALDGTGLGTDGQAWGGSSCASTGRASSGWDTLPRSRCQAATPPHASRGGWRLPHSGSSGRRARSSGAGGRRGRCSSGCSRPT
jgi:hydrogenase maturation protein HypF